MWYVKHDCYTSDLNLQVTLLRFIFSFDWRYCRERVTPAYIRTSAYVLLKFVCGASNYINWRLRTSLNHKSLWMDEWVKSSVHKLHKMLAQNWFLYLKVPQLKSKLAPSRKLHPQSDHIINTHTKQVKTLCMDLSWDHFNSKKNLTPPTKTNPKLSPVSESSTHLLQN